MIVCRHFLRNRFACSAFCQSLRSDDARRRTARPWLAVCGQCGSDSMEVERLEQHRRLAGWGVGATSPTRVAMACVEPRGVQCVLGRLHNRHRSRTSCRPTWILPQVRLCSQPPREVAQPWQHHEGPPQGISRLGSRPWPSSSLAAASAGGGSGGIADRARPANAADTCAHDEAEACG